MSLDSTNSFLTQTNYLVVHPLMQVTTQKYQLNNYVPSTKRFDGSFLWAINFSSLLYWCYFTDIIKKILRLILEM